MNKLETLMKLAAMLDDDPQEVTSTAEQALMDNPYGYAIGKYCIVRSRNEGINAGYVVSATAEAVTLKDARRIWYHKPASKSQSWYEGVALTGLSDDSKVSGAVPAKVIVEDYSLTVCTDVACNSIEGAKTHAQS
jgi:hypothetical protein